MKIMFALIVFIGDGHGGTSPAALRIGAFESYEQCMTQRSIAVRAAAEVTYNATAICVPVNAP